MEAAALDNREAVTVALYRRHRPTRFADLIGQDVVVDTMRNAAGLCTIGIVFIVKSPDLYVFHTADDGHAWA